MMQGSAVKSFSWEKQDRKERKFGTWSYRTHGCDVFPDPRDTCASLAFLMNFNWGSGYIWFLVVLMCFVVVVADDDDADAATAAQLCNVLGLGEGEVL